MAGKTYVVNKRAKFEYEITDTVEAGMMLTGHEVKSIRLGRGSLAEAFVMVREGEVFLHNFNLPGYKFADLREYEPTRIRKLLLHKDEIETLAQKVKSGNVTLVPLKIYDQHKKLKLQVGVGRGRKQYQKKELLKQRDIEREVQREIKERLR